MSAANEIFSCECTDRTGTHEYSVRLLHEFGVGDVSTRKISQLWQISAQHDVLFSDYTKGDPESFISVYLDPASVWFEVVRSSDNQIVGAIYISRLIPRFDAWGHFAFWDAVAKGRENIVLGTGQWIFDRYQLRRISAEVPSYQSGTLRFIREIGFRKEGERREGVPYKGKWFPLIMFGLLKPELEDSMAKFGTPRPTPPLDEEPRELVGAGGSYG